MISTVWLVILLWFIISIIVAMISRYLWWVLWGAASSSLIASLATWNFYLLIPFVLFLLSGLYPFAYNVYNAKIQDLRNEINYKEQGTQIAFDERQKLKELEEVSFSKWVFRLFLRPFRKT